MANARQAIKLLTDGERSAGHLDRPLRSRAGLFGGPGSSRKPMPSSTVCIKRRGEALSLFLDEEPTYSYLPPVYYYQGRVREELKNAGLCRIVPRVSQSPRHIQRRPAPAGSPPPRRLPLGARPSNACTGSYRRAALRAPRKNIGNSAGEAGLLDYSDRLLVPAGYSSSRRCARLRDEPRRRACIFRYRGPGIPIPLGGATVPIGVGETVLVVVSTMDTPAEEDDPTNSRKLSGVTASPGTPKKSTWAYRSE